MPVRHSLLTRSAAGLALALAIAGVSAPVQAATVVPPEDLAQLAAGSDAVVLAIAGESEVIERGALLWTHTRFVVDTPLSGRLAAGDEFRVQSPGGEAGGRLWHVSGAPRFQAGTTYLLSLDAKEDGLDDGGLWVPRLLSWGLLRATRAADGTELLAPLDGDAQVALLERQDGALPEPAATYRRDELVAHLADFLDGVTAWNGAALRVADEPDRGGVEKAPPSECAFFESGGRHFRWRAFDTGGNATMYAQREGDRSVAGGGFVEIVQAMDRWMAFSGTSANLVFGGAEDRAIACSGGQDAREDTIVFNDPCSDMGDLNGCSGVLAYGGPLSIGTHSFDGDTWYTIVGWIVVVNNGSGCIGSRNYEIMMAHELGHGLGYGHVDDSGAMMYANCCNAPNSTDRLCARFTYPASDPDNERPTVDAGGDRRLVLLDGVLRLSGTANDDGLPANPGELSYRWRQVSGPVGVEFSSPTALATEARFPRSGDYTLVLTADDGDLIRTDPIRIEVLATGAGAATTRTFQQGVAGYSSTVDTFLQEAAPEATNGGAPELSIDADDPGGSGQSTQTLMRFDDLFGDDVRQIPPGRQIASARLELTTTNQGAGATLHRMMGPWEDDVAWASFGASGVRRGADAVSAADAIAAGGADLVIVDVTESVAAWSSDPCSNFGWAFLPRTGGDDGWDFESAEGTTPARLVVEYTDVAQETIVAPGASWDYFKGTESPTAGWTQPEFEPGAGWSTGPTGIGYGDGDDATVLGDMEDGYLTVFCRHEFEIPADAEFDELRLTVAYDDGVVVYLDGEELGRRGMPGGAVGPNTAATGSGEALLATFIISPELATPGAHVLAASVHNSTIGSSDLSFNAALAPVTAILPVDCEPQAEPEFIRGDGNDDGAVNITDALAILGYLFQSGAEPACLDAMDVNDDGSVDVADAVSDLLYLFGGLDTLPEPNGACGVDPTADDVDSCASEACPAG